MDWFLYDIGLRHERVKERSDSLMICRLQFPKGLELINLMLLIDLT